MNRSESLLLEAVKNMLDDRVKLGLSIHDGRKEKSHTVQFDRENIENTMRVKLNDPKISMYDSICGAFFHMHSYKNIDDPSFDLAFRKQMNGMVVPPEEQDLAIKYLDEIRKEYDLDPQHYGRRRDTFSNSAESYLGGTPNLDQHEVSDEA